MHAPTSHDATPTRTDGADVTEQLGGWSSPDPHGPASAPDSAFAPSPPPGAPGTAYDPYGRGHRGVVPLRPLGVGEMLDGAVAVLRRFPRPIFAAGAAVAVIGGLADLAVSVALVDKLSVAASGSGSGQDSLGAELGTALPAQLFTLLLGALTGAVLTGVVTAVVGRAVFGDATTLRQGWELVRPRLVPLVLVSLWLAVGPFLPLIVVGIVVAVLAAVSVAAAVIVGLIALPAAAVLGVWLYVRWSLAPAAVVLEKQPVRTALTRSSTLVHRSFWRVFGVLLLALLITAFIAGILQLPLLLVGGSPLRSGTHQIDLGTGRLVLSAVVGALVTTFVAPFTAAVRALLYVDRRMRAEGLDVALVAAAAARS